MSLEHESIKDEEWDNLLEKHNKEEKERCKKKKYVETANNCYSFIIRFLNKVRFQSNANHNKEKIVIDFVGQYFKLFLKLVSF